MSNRHFPLNRLIAASLLTVAVCIWLGWTVYDESRLVETLQRNFRFEELEGQVLHLDEVLTMSARMAAASGDARWEKRYRKFEPQLDAAIKEAIQLFPYAIRAADAAQIDDANAKLVAMENRAFGLIRDGDAEQARAVLFSNEYEEQKKIYADALEQLVASIDKQMGDAVNSRRSQIRFSISGAMGALIVTLIVWLVAVRSVRHWRTALERAVHERTEAEQATRRANEELEVRVLARTAELAKTNEALQVENAERKRAEETLRESDEKFRQLAKNITDVFWMTSPDLRKTHYVSPAYEQVWGRSAARLYAHPQDWAAAILPEDRERTFKTFGRLSEDESSVSVEFRITRPDGTVRWILSRGFQVRDAADKVIRITGIASDVTERKRVEQALQESEARTKAIVQSSLDCIVAINHEGKILEFNPAAEKVFGHSRAAVLGRELAQVIIPPSLRERHRQGMAHYLATGEARVMGKRIEITALRSDGSEFPVELAITRMGAETPPTFTGFIRDISERKRAEWQLNIQYAISRVLAESSTLRQASSRILQTVCENLNWDVGEFWNVDRRAEVMQFDDMWIAPNIHADDFIALSRQITFARGVGLPGRAWESGEPVWVPDVAVDANFPRVAAAKKVGLHSAFSVPILAGNEVVGVIEFFSREIRQPDEDLLHMFAVLGSQLGQFFERKRLEEHLIQSQKMETVGRLSGGIAHEFNSILTAIIGQSELLLTDLPSGDPLARNATEIRKAADRAATLTRQLLAYGRKQILQPETLDLNRVVGSMDGMFRHVMGSDVDVRIVPAAGLKAVKADAGQIEQVIMNMAINAREAMPGGGKLTLETSNVTLDKEWVGRFPELKPGNYVMLAITDTGRGMREEVKARIFEPFFSTKGVAQGTGLGLATCYGIVKQSGGHISVYSEPGKGTTFKIYLPETQGEAKTLARPAEPIDLPHGTETILFVEDDPGLCEMASMLLKRLGYSVLAAANGMSALNLVEQRGDKKIDLLFTDVVMPQLNGNELSERVLALYPETKVLFTTAYTENAVVHQGVLNPDVAILQKPFTPSALACKLREVLDAEDTVTVGIRA